MAQIRFRVPRSVLLDLQKCAMQYGNASTKPVKALANYSTSRVRDEEEGRELTPGLSV
jgi:hypothetical protein